MPGSLFLWGLVALVQIVFLPGHILTRMLRLRPGIVDALLLSFGLSTLVNYLLVQILVFSHLFNRPAVIGIIAVEIVIAAWLRGRVPVLDRWQRSAENYQGALTAWRRLFSPERAAVLVAAVLAIYCTFSFAHFATAAWQDEAFTLWDNVMSWNRWATDWFEGKFPGKTYHYPQLLPANSSIVYVLAGTTAVQAFNRLFFAFFPIAFFVGLLDLGIRRRQIGFWLGIPLTYFGWTFIGRPFPAEGYADVPVGFFIFMAFYSALLAGEQKDRGHMTRWMLAAGLLSGAALVTKQTGMVIVLTLPLVLALVIDHLDVLSAVQKRQAIMSAFALAFLISVPWYIIKEVQIRTGVDQSEVSASLNAHGGRNWPERIQFGVHQMFGAWGTVQTVTIAALAAGAAFIRTPWRWAVLLIVFPGFLVWGITTSYDLRNSNFIIMLGCVSAGVTLGHLLERASARMQVWSHGARGTAMFLVLAILAVILSFLPSVSNPVLLSRSNQAQRTTAMPDLNAALFRLIEEHKITRPVITNYWMMYFIPGLRQYIAYHSFVDPKTFAASIAQLNPEFIAILHPSQVYPALSDEIIADHIAKGQWTVAVTGPSFRILEIHTIPVTPLEIPRARFGGFKVISGLAPEEGPYPAWNLPVVRWGLGPKTQLEFESKIEQVFELSFEIARPSVKLTLGVFMNGVPVGRTELTGVEGVKEFKIPLNAHPGTNQLELRYSAWDMNSDTRPLAILYQSILILPK